ncbi:response regulator transcription factor [Palleronia rufa]|uniref:response regulator transcription factor n=1 Tax=Palleronia rufa TaxID=1530186 RepID=UPI000564B00A|nr:response regulator transcription factor [Palleronia rufa]
MTDTRPVLIVDDEPQIASALSRGLALHGFATVAEHDAEGALARLRGGGLRAAVIDVMLGPDSGLRLVARARELGVGLPILMLSALSEVEDRTAGLDAGADDYVVKPFSLDELVARLRVQERRVSQTRSELVRAERAVRGAGREVVLTEREFALLSLLAAHAGEVLSRGYIFDTLWSKEGTSSENIVDVYVGYLRKKMDPMTGFGFEIHTLRNRGFRLTGTRPQIA